MPYLKSVVDLGLPDFINHLIPIVETSLETRSPTISAIATVTTGTISPGVIWAGKYFQVGFEAMIPVNRQSGTRCRRPRTIALLSRRHLPDHDRPAADRRHAGRPPRRLRV